MQTADRSRDSEAPLAIVTGATGYIGSHLVRELDRTGWNVLAVVRAKSAASSAHLFAENVRLMLHDGSSRHLVSAFGGMPSENTVIFHLASHFVAEHEIDDIDDLVDGNLRFGLQVMEAMSRNGLRKIVNTGTNWQHFQGKANSPACLYAATKSAANVLFGYFVDAHAFQILTLELFDVYGPADSRQKLFNLLRRATQTSEDVAMSPGQQLLDLVYIDDVVNAYSMAGQQLIDGNDELIHQTYAISSGRQISLRDVAAMYENICGEPAHIHWGGRPYRRREVMVPWTQVAALPGWHARTSLEEGIRHLDNWLRHSDG